MHPTRFNPQIRHNMKKATYLLLIACALIGCNRQKIQKIEGKPIEYVNVGSASVIYGIQDNFEEKKHAADLFDAPASLMEELGLQDGVASSIRTYMIKDGNEYTLIDAGLGEMGGQTMERLGDDIFGLNPEDISRIYLTHMHGDHIGGLLFMGEALYPNAELYISKKEYEAENVKTEGLSRLVIDAYADRIRLFEPGETLPHGVVAVDMPGHTIGHVGFRYGNILMIGDAIHGWDLQYEHPDYCAAYDADKEQAVETRKQVIDLIRSEKLIIAGSHLPFAFKKI